MACVAIAGCSRLAPVDTELFFKTELGLKWPAPPAAPRVELVRLVDSPASFKRIFAAKDRSSRFVEWLVGEDIEDVETFSRPYGVHRDGDRLFVVDQGLRMVLCLDLSHGVTRYLFSTPENTPLFFPTSVTTDSDRNIYIADPEVGRIVVYDPALRPVRTFGSDLAPWRPCAVSCDRKRGIIYVADSLNHVIRKFTTSFEPLGTMGRRGDENGEFNFPSHLFVDRDGDLYVTDSLNFRVQIFDTKGRFLARIGAMGKHEGGLERPKGVCVDSRKHVYVVDSLKGQILVYDRDNRYLMSIGDEGRFGGQFDLAAGIYCDDRDFIYVADTLNGRMQVLRYVGGVQ